MISFTVNGTVREVDGGQFDDRAGADGERQRVRPVARS